MKGTFLPRCLALAAAMAIAGCAPRPPVATTPALPPAGAAVTVSYRGAQVPARGELVAVDSTGIHLLGDGALRLVSWARIVSIDVEKLGPAYDVAPHEVVTGAKRRALSLISRFPQGLPATATATLGVAAIDSSLAGPPPVSPESSADSVAELAAALVARLADQRVAADEGYSRIGTDYPGMGEPWISFGALARKTVDPANPVLLFYAPVNGRVSLVSVGYVVTTRGAEPAVGAPGWPRVWHEHAGVLVEDSVPARPTASATAADSQLPRVWVLHLWTGLPNAEGAWHPDNWMLPFARLGLRLGGAITYEAARAASLTVAKGDAYLLRLLEDANFNVAPNSRTVARVAAARERAAAIIRGRNQLDPPQLDALALTWRTLVKQLQEVDGDRVLPFLAPPHRVGDPRVAP
ncbi:MAG TPA: hypothetical protein VGD77_08035 [Gemmatimonadaceae bacterium]